MAVKGPDEGDRGAPNGEVRTAHVDDPAATILEPVADATEATVDALPADPDADPAVDATEEAPSISALKAKKSLFDEERDAIGERYAARRAAEAGITPESSVSTSDDPAVGPDGQPVAAGAKPAGTDTSAPTTPAMAPRITEPTVERRHKINVNGVDVEVSDADMLRAAQKALSGDSAAAPALREADPATRETTGQQSDPARPRLRIDPARLTSVVERLQTGTTEDGAEGLMDLLTEAMEQGAAQATRPEDVRSTVKEALSEQAATEEASRALNAFAARFKTLATDDDMAEAVVKQTSREILADFKRIGLPDDQIAHAARDPAFMIKGYRQLRTQVNPATGQPWALRSYDEILTKSGETIAKKFNIAIQPAPGAEPGRIRRDGTQATLKDGLTPQPRSAGLPADAGRLSGNDNRNPASRTPGRSIVEEERRARGFA